MGVKVLGSRDTPAAPLFDAGARGSSANCTAFPAQADWCDAVRESHSCECDNSSASIYHFVPYGYNFGDVVGPMVVEGFASCFAQCVHKTSAPTGWPTVLVGLGSVLHHHYSPRHNPTFAEQFRQNVMATTHLWGTGEIGFGSGIHYDDSDPRIFRQRGGRFHAAATRGPLTRDWLKRNGLLAEPRVAEPVFGDPAMLLPSLFPCCRRSCKPTRKLCVIPHHKDIAILQKEVQSGKAPAEFSQKNVRKVQTKVEEMIEFILGCELVISSSLHGIIFAEAFGVPARWWAPPKGGTARTERSFKYQDYYAGTRPHLFERYRELWSSSHKRKAVYKCADITNSLRCADIKHQFRQCADITRHSKHNQTCAHCLGGGSSCAQCEARGFNCTCECKWAWEWHQGSAEKIYGAHGPLASDPFRPAATIAEAAQLGGAPPLSRFNATALLGAFPLKLATGCNGACGRRRRSTRAEPLGANRACVP